LLKVIISGLFVNNNEVIQRAFHALYPVLPISFVSSQKKPAKEKDVAQSPRGSCRAELAEPLSADSAQTEPLRSDQR